MFKDIYNSFYESIIYDGRYKYIFEGLFNTLIIALFACLIGVFIGILIAIIRHNHDTNGKLKILNKVVTWYVNVIRGTPVLLQLMIIYYVIFKSVDISIVIVGIVAFGLNSGAYVSEIIRSGINSIDKGQMEAGLSLGLSYRKVMRYIIMPQGIRNVMPALGNEFITLIKETSAGAYIGIMELTKASDIMTCNVCTCSENDDVCDAEKKMSEYQIRRIPVVENNKVVGILLHPPNEIALKPFCLANNISFSPSQIIVGRISLNHKWWGKTRPPLTPGFERDLGKTDLSIV